jgi:hypothetical protein
MGRRLFRQGEEPQEPQQSEQPDEPEEPDGVPMEFPKTGACLEAETLRAIRLFLPSTPGGVLAGHRLFRPGTNFLTATSGVVRG